MKPIIPFLSITVFLLLLAFSNVGYARKDLEDYWNRKMEGQAMPEVIKDLVAQIQNQNQNQPSSSVSDDSEKDSFVRDFDIKPNVILYHTHVEKKMKIETKMKPSVKKLGRFG